MRNFQNASASTGLTSVDKLRPKRDDSMELLYRVIVSKDNARNEYIAIVPSFPWIYAQQISEGQAIEKVVEELDREIRFAAKHNIQIPEPDAHLPARTVIVGVGMGWKADRV
jgi:predicted RNase H-like HicB family nuclease